MPFLSVNGVNLHYTDTGGGPDTIVFSHGLLFSGEMFMDQIAVLKSHYRCITFDHRGQGQSEVSAVGYDIDSLTEDAIALIEALEVAPCHFVGLSMGGFVGLRLGFRRPEMLKSLTLINTSADAEAAENKGRYKLLNFVAHWFGLRIVVGKVMPIMFGPTFLADQSKTAERKKWRDVIVSNHRLGITRAVKGVVARSSVEEDIRRISLPTLIIVGEEDAATPPDKAKAMHERIPDSQLIVVPEAGHSSTIEQPEIVTKSMVEFLEK